VDEGKPPVATANFDEPLPVALPVHAHGPLEALRASNRLNAATRQISGAWTAQYA
jgi:hypothetical protein